MTEKVLHYATRETPMEVALLCPECRGDWEHMEEAPLCPRCEDTFVPDEETVCAPCLMGEEDEG
jgi:predicted amidophosphoribosyltransferase